MKKKCKKNKVKLPLGDYPVRIAWLYLPFKKKTSGAFFRMLGSIFYNFFFLQYKRFWQEVFYFLLLHKDRVLVYAKHKSVVPIVNVDNPLDSCIPFLPRKVKIYLDFVNFFIRVFSCLVKVLGKKACLPYSATLFNTLNTIYANCGEVYKLSMSTTTRPHYHKGFHFKLIHVFDPHYLCVPSLHVSIVTACYIYMLHLFNENASIQCEEATKSLILKEVFTGSVMITEAVLYIKQHSINCVAAAFFMLHASKVAGEFPYSEVEKVTYSLFTERASGGYYGESEEKEKMDIKVTVKDKDAVCKYILNTYSALCSRFEENKGNTWQEVIHQFLKEYRG